MINTHFRGGSPLIGGRSCLSYDELTKAALGLRDTFEERQPRQPDFPRVILTRFVANTLRSGVLLHHPRFLTGLPFAGSLCSG